MTFKTVCPVKNNQVLVTLPPNFSDKRHVTIYVDDQIDLKSQKLDLMRIASSDPLFLADIHEVHRDFDSIDHETL